MTTQTLADELATTKPQRRACLPSIILRVFLALLMMFIIAACASRTSFAPMTSQSPDSDMRLSASPIVENSTATRERITILLMGADNRPDEPIARTDAIIVVSLDLKTGALGILSLSRDILMRVPSLNDSVKINTIHVYGEVSRLQGGGPELLRQTVSETLGFPIDYYARVNFTSFQQIVDLVGGIDISVPATIRDDLYPDTNYGYDPLYVSAGWQHMDGAMTLKYVRTRHTDSDYGRIARQQQVLLALKNKLRQPGELAALLPKIPKALETLGNSVKTNISLDDAFYLARALERLDSSAVTSIVVDNRFGVETTDDRWGNVLLLDSAKLRSTMATLFMVPRGQQIPTLGSTPTASNW